MVKNNMVLFWGGTFSQWFPSDFIIDGIKYFEAKERIDNYFKNKKRYD